MSLHQTPAEHTSDPPAKWEVVKTGNRAWDLRSSLGGRLATYATRQAALADRESGFYVSLYEREGRWFAGQPVAGWKPYKSAGAVVIKADTCEVLLTDAGFYARCTQCQQASGEIVHARFRARQWADGHTCQKGT